MTKRNETAYVSHGKRKIARIARREPETYASCERVSLVSSFVTSILAGQYCSIDASDASGMNLMDIRCVCMVHTCDPFN